MRYEGKWIVEIIEDEICIGKIYQSNPNEFDNEFRDFRLIPVIVWIPNSDDWERVGGIHVMEAENIVPEHSFMAFRKQFVQDARPSDRDILKFVLEFNPKKV